jgi:hypothetical protein
VYILAHPRSESKKKVVWTFAFWLKTTRRIGKTEYLETRRDFMERLMKMAGRFRLSNLILESESSSTWSKTERLRRPTGARL